MTTVLQERQNRNATLSISSQQEKNGTNSVIKVIQTVLSQIIHYNAILGQSKIRTNTPHRKGKQIS